MPPLHFPIFQRRRHRTLLPEAATVFALVDQNFRNSTRMDSVLGNCWTYSVSGLDRVRADLSPKPHLPPNHAVHYPRISFCIETCPSSQPPLSIRLKPTTQRMRPTFSRKQS